MGKWGDSFARWYYGRGKGQQFLLCLSLVVMVSIGLVLLDPTPERQPKGAVEIQCGSEGLSRIYLSVDDPRWGTKGLSNADLDRICDEELR
ncbi:hypothetical protein [Mycobacterium sp. 236(2023)]|uniref:hypothetical protein n=1 Tax=Mycobacterium sp. 236(2023) TaxID=3038163 RepID=UPI002414D6BA|nr:hypothetical protein [Mycobacterium sp. 236(2023)]MDG4668008.1 hypothetical protein [Mycobacterium sp. 236(2023)]